MATKARTQQPKNTAPSQDFDAALAGSIDKVVPGKAQPDTTQAAEEAALFQADKAEADISAPPAPSPSPAPTPKPPKTKVTVRDFSTDKPNRPIEEYRTPKDGRSYPGSSGRSITKRDSGINRFAVLIARPGGCTEADGRHVNPRGYEYSGSFARYVADNTGMSIVVRDGRYQVAEADASGNLVPNDVTRKVFYDALGGDAYLDQVVAFIRSNTKYDYSGFTLSEAPTAVAA